ncbi:MAG TPA: addiction module protein [Planctomycetota bacterium]|nr:addiction module protein [Planctomycetota bacterium]HRR81089.1 addiction module protein [Planctomycetota bacterium]HRT94351.1 addiction module protein [Planctomycetota bacterium]
MSPRTQEVLTEALALSAGERAELMEQLLASFGIAERERVDTLWAEEAEDRIDAYDRGELRAKPASEVFHRIERSRTR